MDASSACALDGSIIARVTNITGGRRLMACNTFRACSCGRTPDGRGLRPSGVGGLARGFGASRFPRRGDGVVHGGQPETRTAFRLGDVLEVLLVALRQRHRGDAGAHCTSTLFLMPPMGSTRPRGVISPVMAVSWPGGRQQQDQGGEHGDAGARDRLGDGAGGNVDADVGFGEDSAGSVAELGERARDQAERGGARLSLHDVAESGR